MQSRGDITALLRMAFSDGTVSIFDISQLSGEKKDAFLISALFSASTLEEIRNLINISKPSRFSWDAWVSVVTREIISLAPITLEARSYSQRKFKECILSVANKYPTLQIVVIVVLLKFLYEALVSASEISESNSKSRQEPARNHSDKDNFNLSKAVIDCLLFFDSVGIDTLNTDIQKQWLLETEKWFVRGQHRENTAHIEDAIDLLMSCIVALETCENLDGLSEENDIEPTIGFIKSLVRIRQGLKVS